MAECPCGKAPERHTAVDALTLAAVRAIVAALGPFIAVPYNGEAWMVPRWWIALHGLSAAELPVLAKQLQWEQVR